MSRPPRAALAAVALAVAASGCARCDGEPSGAQAGGASSSARAPEPVPPPAPWTFSTVRGPPNVAAPERCRFRAPVYHAAVPPTTHFIVDARSLGLLSIAETQLDPPSVLRSGSLAVAADGKTTAAQGAPWPHARVPPRVARLGDQWVAAWEVPAGQSASEVRLARGTAPVASLGRGEAFVAADLACGASRCALLTSRPARVAPAGADVVLFEADAQKPPRTIAIEPPEADSTARPFGMASVEGARGAVAVLADRAEAVFWSVEAEGGPAPIARLAAPYGVLDAMLLGDRPLVLAHGNAVDAEGCAREGLDAAGAKVSFLRPGEAPITVSTPGAPSLVTLRPLARGALALWLSPLGCGAQRRVVYGVAVDATGAPSGTPIPVADGDTFAVAASGSDVDLWIRSAEEVSWLRLTCDVP